MIVVVAIIIAIILVDDMINQKKLSGGGFRGALKIRGSNLKDRKGEESAQYPRILGTNHCHAKKSTTSEGKETNLIGMPFTRKLRTEGINIVQSNLIYCQTDFVNKK